MMPPLPEPGATFERCLQCGAPVSEPRPPFCPNCGASLQKRPLWLSVAALLSVAASLGAALLAFVGLCLGGFGACVAVLVGAEGGGGGGIGTGSGGLFSSDALWIWGCMIGGLLCVVAAVFILRWLLKKPKRRV